MGRGEEGCGVPEAGQLVRSACEPHQRGGEGVDVTWRDQEPVDPVGHEVADSAHLAGDDRTAQRPGFGEHGGDAIHVAVGTGDAGRHHDVGRAHRVHDFRPGACRPQAQPGRCLIDKALRPDDVELNLGNVRARFGPGLDENAEALLGHGTPDSQHPAELLGRLRCPGQELAERRRVGDDHHLVGGDPARHDEVPMKAGDGDDSLHGWRHGKPLFWPHRGVAAEEVKGVAGEREGPARPFRERRQDPRAEVGEVTVEVIELGQRRDRVGESDVHRLDRDRIGALAEADRGVAAFVGDDLDVEAHAAERNDFGVDEALRHHRVLCQDVGDAAHAPSSVTLTQT